MADFSVTAASWQREDADWERWQAAGSAACAAGNNKTASDAFSHALRIARQHFEPGDPRLASSLASHAFMLSQKGDPLSKKLFGEALEQWNQIKIWLDRQPLPKLARSSMFHVRLETKHPGSYPNHAHQRCLALAAEGLAATTALAAGHSATDEAPDKVWRPQSQRDFDTVRKISSAIRLMARR